MKIDNFLVTIGLTLCLILPGKTIAAEANHHSLLTITFGVVPQQAASKLARKWGPILTYLGKRTGYNFKFSTAKNIPIFEQRLAAGRYDMAYMNPYHYTVFHRSPGYLAFAREKNKKIKGIIVVRKDSLAQNLKSFEGKTLAFPAPAAFAASVLPRAALKKRHIFITPKYVSSHDSVYRAVAMGLYPAGGGVMRTFYNMAPEVKKKLRILWTTKSYTPHAIAAHPRLSKEVIEKVQLAMGELETNSEGRKMLANLNFKGIELAHDAEWNDVRDLGIELLESLINKTE
ncbi:ABC transporter, substrate-binding protein (cluster 12, methionine/phosphonates) [hydrothermal vent metagenome]|uniref:ABC transporter, substrate-binding protein (Cluster 12, methionine/phosphonates) n=1 Tax=hydrothermal vent metagenome TaxID=652676 RepID=A0A3B1ATH8_9ZZZZ